MASRWGKGWCVKAVGEAWRQSISGVHEKRVGFVERIRRQETHARGWTGGGR